MILGRISGPPPADPEPEDIFFSALTTIFTDDTVNSHGTPGSYVIYQSPRFGEIKLQIPVHPDEEDGRKLFAHSLWNAGVVAADAIESASTPSKVTRTYFDENVREFPVQWDRRHFNVRNQRVIELGAGTALPSIIAGLCNAAHCTITDHPSSPALTTKAIEVNCGNNLTLRRARPPTTPPSAEVGLQQNRSCPEENEVNANATAIQPNHQHRIRGYTWGTNTFYSPDKFGIPAPKSEGNEKYDRIFIADCLWMPSQHINLIRTILHFLPEKQSVSTTRDVNDSHELRQRKEKDAITTDDDDDNDDSEPCAIVIAGFHTGRTIVADFFSLATELQDTAAASPSPSPSLNSTNLPPEPSTPSSQNPPQSSSPTPSPQSSTQTTATTTTTTPLPRCNLNPSERQTCGLLRLAQIFEVDVDGNTRPWQDIRPGEGKWEGKRWVVVGVLVRR